MFKKQFPSTDRQIPLLNIHSHCSPWALLIWQQDAAPPGPTPCSLESLMSSSSSVKPNTHHVFTKNHCFVNESTTSLLELCSITFFWEHKCKWYQYKWQFLGELMEAQWSVMKKLSPNCSFGFFWSIRFKKDFSTNYCQNVNKSKNEVLNLFCKCMKNGLKWELSTYTGNLASR